MSMMGDQTPPTQPGMGRLQSTFHGSTLNDHGDKWDALWKESYTPWDRGGPSLALADLIREHPELFPPHNRGARRKTALVPGCGRGYDVLLLSALGYDVIGLDYSAVAVREAATNEQRVLGGRDKELYDSFVGHEGRGAVSWKEGDFFEDSWVVLVSRVHYDLIYDYTFFCAIPPEGRPKWAERMSALLTPRTGRLVCLEWPLRKDPSEGGPPWGLTAETYVAHLTHPGEEISYGDDGRPLADEVDRPPTKNALKRLTRFQPRRTHQSGLDSDGNIVDFISVWGH